MMPELSFFRDLVLAISAALLGGVTAQRLGQPPLLGYLLGGILIGPYTPGPVSDIRHVSTLAEIGVVLLMFELGVEFPVARLRRLGAVALGGGLLQVILTGAVAIGIARAIGFPLIQQVFFGAILSLSSTVVVLKLLLDRGEMDTPHGKIAVGICLIQDLSLVAMMVLLPTWAAAEGEAWRALLIVALVKTLALFVGAYFAGGLLLPALFAAVARLRSRELFLLAVILVVIGTTVALAALGLSTALGAYLAGVVVSRSHYSRQVLAELVPGRDLFASLFFVSVGMLVDPRLLWHDPGTLLVVIAVITFLKAGVTASVVRTFGYPGRAAIMTGLLLAQVGELSFVLAKLVVDRRFISEELYGLVLGGALISILVNPALLRHGGPWLLRRLVGPAAPSPATGSWAEASGLADHVVICGCGRVGSEMVAQLRARGLPYMVIELNPIRVDQLRREGEPCLFGDANNLYILKAAGIERARLLAITHYDAASAAPTIETVREIHPSLKVIARAHHAADLERLRNAGASAVVMPEFEAGMEFLRWTLGHLGLPAEEIETVIERRRADFRPSESIAEPTLPGAS